MRNYLFWETLLEYHHIDNRDLPDEVWAWKIRFLIDIREQEAKANKL